MKKKFQEQDPVSWCSSCPPCLVGGEGSCLPQKPAGLAAYISPCRTAGMWLSPHAPMVFILAVLGHPSIPTLYFPMTHPASPPGWRPQKLVTESQNSLGCKGPHPVQPPMQSAGTASTRSGYPEHCPPSPGVLYSLKKSPGLETVFQGMFFFWKSHVPKDEIDIKTLN